MDELRDEIALTLLQKFSQMHRSFLSSFHLLILVLFTMSMSLWGDAYYEDISLVKGERERKIYNKRRRWRREKKHMNE